MTKKSKTLYKIIIYIYIHTHIQWIKKIIIWRDIVKHHPHKSTNYCLPSHNQAIIWLGSNHARLLKRKQHKLSLDPGKHTRSHNNCKGPPRFQTFKQSVKFLQNVKLNRLHKVFEVHQWWIVNQWIKHYLGISMAITSTS